MSMNTPAGTRGGRPMNYSNPVAKFMMKAMSSVHRRQGYKFSGMNLLFLTTIGRKSGEIREHPVSWFSDGEDAWLIVASAGGSRLHPAWYLNMAAHPDQVWAEFPGRKVHVAAEELEGEARDQAFAKITGTQPRYGKYQVKTDRKLPVIRLVPFDAKVDAEAAATTEAAAEPVTEAPVSEPAATAPTAVAEPVAETPVETPVEHVEEAPAAEHVAEPVAEAATEHVAEAPTEAAAETEEEEKKPED